PAGAGAAPHGRPAVQRATARRCSARRQAHEQAKQVRAVWPRQGQATRWGRGRGASRACAGTRRPDPPAGEWASSAWSSTLAATSAPPAHAVGQLMTLLAVTVRTDPAGSPPRRSPRSPPARARRPRGARPPAGGVGGTRTPPPDPP